jgi:hypothetical protein
LHKEKSRPANNFHCFEGMGLTYWRAIALGMTPAQNLSQGPDGAWWELKQDVDGYALQNGGMTSLQETKLNAAFYYRFFGTISHNIYGEKGGMSGGWWIDEENLAKIVNFAERCDYSLARAAAMLLVIPREWHDCGYVGCAWLRHQMKGFVGRGQPAAGGMSPASAMRDPVANPATMSPAHLDVKQYFVPGSRREISVAFELKWVKQAIKPGVAIF